MYNDEWNDALFLAVFLPCTNSCAILSLWDTSETKQAFPGRASGDSVGTTQ